MSSTATAIPEAGPSVDAVSDQFLELVPHEFARDHLIVSQGLSAGGHEQLVISSNTSPAAIHNVGTRLGRATCTTVGNDEQIASLIDEAYTKQSRSVRAHSDAQNRRTQGSTGDMTGLDDTVDADDFDRLMEQAEHDLLTTRGKGPVVRLVDALLFEALSRRASDVHIQPLSDRTLIRYRVDGMLHDVRELRPSLSQAVTSRVKVMGRMDIAERRIAQDGRAGVTIADRPIDLRISTVPTSYGERCVVRLLDNSQQLCDIEQLGMPTEVAGPFLKQATRANGIMLVTGPTGSGKTTTLYSTLRHVASPTLNIMTIEDPIEYELSTVGLAISQSQVNTRKGVTFATGLRHILRQDPDIIMVGEIRDSETARIAIQSSLTGHLVLSTLHTNDAASAVTRLFDLGVEPYLVGASLAAILAQRLVRCVHRECDGTGCDACFGSGLLGRTGLFELMVVSESIRDLILHAEPAGRLRQEAANTGMRTLRHEGLRLVAEGATTQLEVARVVESV